MMEGESHTEPKKLVLNMSLQAKKKSSSLMKPAIGLMKNNNNNTPKTQDVDFISNTTEILSSSFETPKLVIPLTKNNWDRQEEEGVSVSTDDAVAAILSESKNLNKDDRAQPSHLKIKPILQSNMIPGLMDIENEDEKFKHDVSLRAENVSVHSECYEKIPVSNFGEALLRGLGWDGSLGSDDTKREVRPQRLGLGARARPPSPVSNRKLKPGQKHDEKIKDSSWQKDAAKKVQEQSLKVDDIVWLRGARFIKKDDVTRARVHRTTGVAGLNQVEVVLEGRDGHIVSVSRMDAILVDEVQLKSRPFIDKDKKRPRTIDAEKDSKRSKKKSWVLRNIKVRIVKDGKFHRLKGEVIKHDDERCTVLLDDGRSVEGLKDSDLESVIPSVGDQVVIVRGDYRKEKGVIIEKFRDKEEVLVQVEGRRKYFSFDAVTALGSKNSK